MARAPQPHNPSLLQVAENKRYAGNQGWTVSECAAKVGGAAGAGATRTQGSPCSLLCIPVSPALAYPPAHPPCPPPRHRWPRTGATWTSWCTRWPTGPRCKRRCWRRRAAATWPPCPPPPTPLSPSCRCGGGEAVGWGRRLAGSYGRAGVLACRHAEQACGAATQRATRRPARRPPPAALWPADELGRRRHLADLRGGRPCDPRCLRPGLGLGAKASAPACMPPTKSRARRRRRVQRARAGLPVPPCCLPPTSPHLPLPLRPARITRRLRRRHEQRQGGAGERHARAGVRGGAQVRRAGQHHFGGPAGLARRQGHRLHRRHDPVRGRPLLLPLRVQPWCGRGVAAGPRFTWRGGAGISSAHQNTHTHTHTRHPALPAATRTRTRRSRRSWRPPRSAPWPPSWSRPSPPRVRAPRLRAARRPWQGAWAAVTAAAAAALLPLLPLLLCKLSPPSRAPCSPTSPPIPHPALLQ